MSLDTFTRAAERGEDLVAALAARLRSGEVTQERVAYAARLGYGPALGLMEPELVAESYWERARNGALLLGRVEAVRWAADAAEYALERYWRGGDEPTEAVAAARAWADCPCREHAAAADEAGTEASNAVAWTVEASWAARSAACSARAARAASRTLAEPVAAGAAWAVEAAVEAAAWAAGGAPSGLAWNIYYGWLAERLCWGGPA